MRLSCVLLALCLLFGARASQLDSRVPHALDTRELLDVCATITGNLVEGLAIGMATDVFRLGLLDVCLCLSALPLTTNTLDPRLVSIYGGAPFLNELNYVLAQAINLQAAGDNCIFPDHSKPICGPNTCAFECIDGFTPFPQTNPTECRCDEPMQICNGQCVVPNGACPSQQARSSRRRWLGSGSCAERGDGWLACGVYGDNPNAWECLNTLRDLESCGGCVVPLTAYSPKGKDCTTIPNVADVACEWGECVVRHCLHGLVPSADGNSCVSESEYQDSHHHHYHNHHDDGEMEDDSAKAYGLEHMPLQRD